MSFLLSVFTALSRHLRAASLLLAMLLLVPYAHATITVRIQTNLGPIDIDLYDTAAPRTVANFMGYVNSGRYKESFIHRSVPGFIIQGGGYTWDMPQNVINLVPEFPGRHQ